MKIDHEQLANELEEKFIDRFTDKDEDYVKELNARDVSPPCVYPYFKQDRKYRGNNNQYNNRHNNRYNNQYNNYQHNQYGNQFGSNEYNSEASKDSYKKRKFD